MDAEDKKRRAAEHALSLVTSGMRLGLGTGSTAAYFVDMLGEKVRGGLNVTCVPTSKATHEQAKALGINLTTLDDIAVLDLTVDGTDEIDPAMRLIKGGGGALLREKIVATASEEMVVIADDSKSVETLGAFPLSVEVIPFGLRASKVMVEFLASDVGCQGPIKLRTTATGEPFRTDGGNLILDCEFGEIQEPEALDQALKMIPGVVENGLFIGIADRAFIAGENGVTELVAEDSLEVEGEV